MVCKKSVIDIETNALNFETGTHLSSITVIHLVVIKDCQTKEVFSYTEDRLQEALDKINEYDEIIGHNIIGFDYPIIVDKIGPIKKEMVVTDTTVKSRLAHPDKEGGHSLANWGLTLGFPKIEFSDFSQYSEQMLEYCIRDVEVADRLNNYLDKTVYADGKSDRALENEHRVSFIMAQQERHGVCFDLEVANHLVSTLSNRILEIDTELRELDTFFRVLDKNTYSLIFKIDGEYRLNIVNAAHKHVIPLSQIGGPFSTYTIARIDYNSPSQQKELLKELGWKPVTFTPSGGPQLDESIVGVGRIGELLHERNSISNKLSKVTGLLNMLGPTGRLHQGANTIGTPTGRMRHKRLVNIQRPNRPFGRELRSLFKASPKFVLIGYDAAALELRGLAHYIGNEEYTLALVSKDKSRDAHTLARDVARLVDETADRDTGKAINFALVFGAGDYRLGSIVGGGRAEGAMMRAALMSKIPGFKKLTDRVAKEAKKGFLYGLDGRKLILREEHKALNLLVQGAGAIFMKVVMVILDDLVKSANLMAYKVIDMHDESQWEVLDEPITKTMFKQFVRDSFAQATEQLKLRCPQEPEIKEGLNWAETH